MRVASKGSIGLLLACAASLAAAAEQHGELSIWQAAAPGMPAEWRWTHEASGTLSDGLAWQLVPQLQLRQQQASGGSAWWNNGDHPPAASLQRAYLAYLTGDWQLRAGKQIFDWSQTDTISPADLLNPRDWSDLTRVRKLAAPAVSVRYGSQTSVEAVWLPRQQASYLPQAGWMPEAAAALLAPRQQAGGGDQAGVRVAGNWMQTDWSAVVYRGHSIAPSLALAPGPSLQPYYQPLRAVAMTLARQVNDSQIARVEVARYRQPNGNFIQYVASLDKESGDWLHDGDTLYTIVQYAGSTQRANAVDALGWPDFRRVLEHSLMFKASYDRHSDQRRVWELSGVWNTQAHDSYWRMSWQERVGDAVTVTVAGTSMHGQAHSFWGRYAGNDQVTLQVSWRY